MTRKKVAARQRGRDLCHQAFRQTLDLLRVTDEALGELCHPYPRLPDLDGLLLRALNEMALGEQDMGIRSPGYLFLVHGTPPNLRGTVYAFAPAGYQPAGPAFALDAERSYAYSATNGEVVVSNADAEEISLEQYQTRFHPAVREAVGEPIRNFVTYRIAGDQPGAIIAFNYPGGATRYEAQVLSALAITLGSLWTLSSRVGQVEEAFVYLVGALARASEVNDEVTGDHIIRVNRYAETLALACGYGTEEAKTIAYSAELHDVGKIHTPRELLLKPGPLTLEETAVMREHALQGEKIIGKSQRLAPARRIAGGHHENWDGSGYPRGLAGQAIPREARLCKVVDVYDALRSERPYKDAMSHEEACRVLLVGDGRTIPDRHFDPEILDTFRRIHTEFQLIHAEIQV
jgi:HD-GYP domain-containing protein (c-di-GMP phosphodiesterase class II)